MDRLQRGGTGSDLIGQGREAQVDALARITVRLSVQRLMLAELLEEDHGQEVRSCPSPGRRMERRGRLTDLLAFPAGELLPDRLDYLPLPRNDLQRLGDVLTHLRDTIRAAAVTAGRGLDHHALTGKMFGERFACRLAARESANLGRLRRLLGLDRILGGRRFQFLELQFQLIDQPGPPFGGFAVLFSPQLGDLQAQRLDQRLGARREGARSRQFGFGSRRTGFRRGKRGTKFGDFHSSVRHGKTYHATDTKAIANRVMTLLQPTFAGLCVQRGLRAARSASRCLREDTLAELPTPEPLLPNCSSAR